MSDEDLQFRFLNSKKCDCSQILIVDDIDMNRFILKEIIRSKFGLNADEAINGKDCLDIVKEKSL